MILNMTESLKKATIFSKLEPRELKELEKLIKVFQLSKGKIVFNYGDYPADLHFLFHGQLKSVRYAKDGKETVLHIINNGQLFADIPAFLDIPYTGTAVAVKNSIAGRIKRRDFLELLHKYPDVAVKMMGMMAVRTKEFLSRIEDHTAYTPLERLARFLSRQSQQEQSLTFNIPMNKADMARILGTVPETLSRSLSELVSDNIIKLKGKSVQIIDKKKLEEISCEAVESLYMD